MSKYRKVRDQRDTNHSEIVASLRMHGYSVTETERPVDIHIADGSAFGWAEIKTEERDAKVKRTQLEWMSETPDPVTIVKTEGEALVFASNFKGWTEHEKERIAGLLIRNPAKQFTQKQVRDALNGTNS